MTEAAYAVQAIALVDRHHPRTVSSSNNNADRLWRNSSRHREELAFARGAMRCWASRSRASPTSACRSASDKNPPNSSIKTNRCSQFRPVLLGFTQNQGIAGKTGRAGGHFALPRDACSRVSGDFHIDVARTTPVGGLRRWYAKDDFSDNLATCVARLIKNHTSSLQHRKPDSASGRVWSLSGISDLFL